MFERNTRTQKYEPLVVVSTQLINRCHHWAFDSSMLELVTVPPHCAFLHYYPSTEETSRAKRIQPKRVD